MKQFYKYGLLFGLIFLASCAKRPGAIMGTSTEVTALEAADTEETFYSSETPPPPQNNWLRSSDTGIYRTGNPYKVNGIWHFPQKELDPKHDEIGEATWYGQDFHNKMTANGEIFDMNGFTAAHKTLPLPSVIRVTNLSNKKSVILRVNDRGPFDNKRILDVSKKAAELLGFLDQSSAKVRVQVLPEESLRVASMAKGTTFNPQKGFVTQAGEVSIQPLPAPVALTAPQSSTMQDSSQAEEASSVAESTLEPPNAEVLESILPSTIEAVPPSASPSVQESAVETASVAAAPAIKGTTYIQAGAYRSRINAENAIKKLQKVAPAELTEMNKGSQPLYRVRVGPFINKQTAQQKLKQVVSIGHPDATIVG